MGDDGFRNANPIFIRWTSTREGNAVSVPREMLEGPAGQLFTNPVRPSSGPRKMVEEVS